MQSRKTGQQCSSIFFPNTSYHFFHHKECGIEGTPCEQVDVSIVPQGNESKNDPYIPPPSPTPSHRNIHVPHNPPVERCMPTFPKGPDPISRVDAPQHILWYVHPVEQRPGPRKPPHDGELEPHNIESSKNSRTLKLNISALKESSAVGGEDGHMVKNNLDCPKGHHHLGNVGSDLSIGSSVAVEGRLVCDGEPATVSVPAVRHVSVEGHGRSSEEEGRVEKVGESIDIGVGLDGEGCLHTLRQILIRCSERRVRVIATSLF
mmetsp:Transcript_671/g.1543  ORF Transcript_671/g.1543 Transcript_671/m.1543 type:complete len:262 (-) Transcript_671:1166-1951(-)